MRKRKIIPPPLSAYSKEYLVSECKHLGVYKSKYSKQELLNVFREKMRQIVADVRSSRSEDVDETYGKSTHLEVEVCTNGLFRQYQLMKFMRHKLYGEAIEDDNPFVLGKAKFNWIHELSEKRTMPKP